jgi:hypothetical protein
MHRLDAIAVLPPALLDVARSAGARPHDDALRRAVARIGSFSQHAIELGLLLAAGVVDGRLRQKSDRHEDDGG